MRRSLLLALGLASFVAASAASAQSGISLGAAVGTTFADSKLALGESRHGLVYLRLGLPLVPYAARGEFLAFDEPGREYDTAVIASAVVSINTPLVQPYIIAGYGRYGLRSNLDVNGASYGGGLRLGSGRLGVFVEGRRHDPISRDLVSIGFTF
ncbi:MAG: hypothetical protein ACT4R6_14330 [Gemmatimonadaceae bacterium]